MVGQGKHKIVKLMSQSNTICNPHGSNLKTLIPLRRETSCKSRDNGKNNTYGPQNEGKT